MTDLKLADAHGGERIVPNKDVERFTTKFGGEVLRPADRGYDEARRVWNGMVNKRPGLIARCTGTDDVVLCVRFARDHELLVSVRGGGHNYAGKAVCDAGLMIDLSPMKGVRVDVEKRTVRAQAGLRLGELDRETQRFGLATTLGVNTDTGIAGLTLGGGYGWLASKYGLACDNLIAAEVVTADDSVIEANAVQHEDLFWGLRGAGANFGVVTTFEYKLHPVDTVFGGQIVYPLSADVLRFFDEFSMGAPDEVTTLGVVSTAPDGKPAFGVVVCHCGPENEAVDVLKALRSFAQPVADLIAPRSYLDMQSLLDDVWPSGRYYYHKANNIRSLNDDAIRIVLEYGNTLPTPVSGIVFQQLHGASGRVPVTETAFPHRYDHYDLLVHPATDDPTESEDIIRWARDCWGSLQPFVERALYVNAIEDAVEEGLARVREAYGPNYDRLLALKRKYDPTNMFRLNANIIPSETGVETGRGLTSR